MRLCHADASIRELVLREASRLQCWICLAQQVLGAVIMNGELSEQPGEVR